MIAIMILIFLAGYLLIALEHTTKINKAGIALFIGTLLWIIYLYLAPEAVPNVSPEQFQHFLDSHSELKKLSYAEQIRDFVIDHQILESLGEISETIFFLLAAMSIVEMIDSHGGFLYITTRITTRKKRKLLWLIAFITFFMSALLDNLTTSIVMIMLTRKIISERSDRWLFGSMIVIAANSGGAWSPIGDITTIMLWVKGNISVAIAPTLILPSIASVIVPVFIVQFFLKGSFATDETQDTPEVPSAVKHLTDRDRLEILVFGLMILVLTPVFKSITHLPPFVWLLFGMSMLWIFTELMYKNKNHIKEEKKHRMSKIFGHLDFSTLIFFLGILLAVDALQQAGILKELSGFLAHAMPNVYAQGLSIGVLSAIVDNVPLVAAAIGMYPIVDPAALSTFADPEFMQNFFVDGIFWHFLAYCAGVGGSILIIGSAAGVILMGLEGVSFVWYLKRISIVALLGYLAGAGVYILQNTLIAAMS